MLVALPCTLSKPITNILMVSFNSTQNLPFYQNVIALKMLECHISFVIYGQNAFIQNIQRHFKGINIQSEKRQLEFNNKIVDTKVKIFVPSYSSLL